MPDAGHNSGVVNNGTMEVGSGAFGAGAVYVNAPAAAQAAGQPGQAAGAPGRARTDVGIITVLDNEARAIRDELGLQPTGRSGPDFGTGHITAGGQRFTVAAVRALGQGEGPAITAFHHLRERYRPRLAVLAGIAGGIHNDVGLGDVVVSTRVVCYDLRKETPEGTVPRGQERQAPAWVGHAVNRFFTDHGEPAHFRGAHRRGAFRVLCGPIGSGNAVIADQDCKILEYLAAYNDKILAVEMEAAGLSQAYHDQPAAPEPTQGWAVVRGISDNASKDKNDGHHRAAAHHAAIAVRQLLPYLLLADAT